MQPTTRKSTYFPQLLLSCNIISMAVDGFPTCAAVWIDVSLCEIDQLELMLVSIKIDGICLSERVCSAYGWWNT